MTGKFMIAMAGAITVAGCNNPQTQQSQGNQPAIRVRGPEQDQLHQLDAFNLAIGLKRAIYDAGYTCNRITDAGFVGTWKNLDMWMAHCEYAKGPPRVATVSSVISLSNSMNSSTMIRGRSPRILSTA